MHDIYYLHEQCGCGELFFGGNFYYYKNSKTVGVLAISSPAEISMWKESSVALDIVLPVDGSPALLRVVALQG